MLTSNWAARAVADGLSVEANDEVERDDRTRTNQAHGCELDRRHRRRDRRIDGVQIHIMRPPDVANTKGWLHHLQLHKWWQNRHVKTANDGHDVEDGAVKSYQITK